MTDPESIAQKFLAIQGFARMGESYAFAQRIDKVKKSVDRIDAVIAAILTEVEEERESH